MSGLFCYPLHSDRNGVLEKLSKFVLKPHFEKVDRQRILAWRTWCIRHRVKASVLSRAVPSAEPTGSQAEGYFLS
jgi:hypothetical protein